MSTSTSTSTPTPTTSTSPTPLPVKPNPIPTHPTFLKMMKALMFICICFAIIILCMTNRYMSPLSDYTKTRGDEDELIFFDVLTAGTLFWTLVWFVVMGFDKLYQCPLLFVAFLWPILLGIFQLYDVYYERCENIQDSQQQRMHFIGSIHTDTSTVVSFAFACASLFWAISSRGTGAVNVLSSIRILIVALLICIGLIVPTQHFLDNNQRYTTYARACQRVFVNYSLGFILTALMVLLANC